MVKRIGSIRRKSRQKYSKTHRRRGKISISKYFQKFEAGDVVGLSLEPAVMRGTYAPKFYGKTGVVKSKRGTCYEIAIKDINKPKVLIVHPVHLIKLR